MKMGDEFGTVSLLKSICGVSCRELGLAAAWDIYVTRRAPRWSQCQYFSSATAERVNHKTIPCQTDADVGRCVAPIHDRLPSRRPSAIISKEMYTLWRTLQPHRESKPRNPRISFILIRTRVTRSPQLWISLPLARQQNKDAHPTSCIHCLSDLTERSVRHKSLMSTTKSAPLRNMELRRPSCLRCHLANAHLAQI